MACESALVLLNQFVLELIVVTLRNGDQLHSLIISLHTSARVHGREDLNHPALPLRKMDASQHLCKAGILPKVVKTRFHFEVNQSA